MSQLGLFAGTPTDNEVDSTDRQNTPRDLAHDLGRFGVDPCGNPASHILADIYFSLEAGQNGLELPWTIGGIEGADLASVWCNGPYSDPLPWCQRLRAHRAPWCALWKFDSTTTWFEELVLGGAWWAPFKNRIRFERNGQGSGAMFINALFWRDWTPPAAILSRLWTPRREVA